MVVGTEERHATAPNSPSLLTWLFCKTKLAKRKERDENKAEELLLVKTILLFIIKQSFQKHRVVLTVVFGRLAQR